MVRLELLDVGLVSLLHLGNLGVVSAFQRVNRSFMICEKIRRRLVKFILLSLEVCLVTAVTLVQLIGLLRQLCSVLGMKVLHFGSVRGLRVFQILNVFVIAGFVRLAQLAEHLSVA